MRLLFLLPILVSCTGSPESPIEESIEFHRISPLIDRLRTADIEGREKAMLDLFELGPDALPLVRLTRDLEPDAEVGARLTQVIGVLEEQESVLRLVGRPPLVTLVRRMTLGEALAELSRQSGIAIESREVATDAVTDVNVRGAPIWDAIDVLCRSAGLQPEWSGDRVTLVPGPFVETSHGTWKVGPIPVGRFWLECEDPPRGPTVYTKILIRVHLLVMSNRGIDKLILNLDAGDDDAGNRLVSNLSLSGSVIDAERVRFTLEEGVVIPPECHTTELRNLHGRLSIRLARPNKVLGFLSELTPGSSEVNPDSGVRVTCTSSTRDRQGLRLSAILTYPGETTQKPDRIRILVPPGPIYASKFEANPLAGSKGLSRWYLSATFFVAHDAPITGLEVVETGPSQLIDVEFDLPRVPVRR